MKIVHVIDAIDPALGGPPGVVIRLGAAQAVLGHDVHIVSYGDTEASARIAASSASVPQASALRFHLVTPSSSMERLVPRAARAILETVLRDADFIHLHGVWESILLTAATIARRHSIPYAVCPHGMLDTWSLMQKASKKQLALRLGRRAMLEKAAFIHALNEDEVALMGPPGLSTPKRVFPNGVFLEEVEPLPQPGLFRAQWPSLKDRRFILFMSRLHHKKGLDILAEAFARIAPFHPDIDLVVVGPDAGSQAGFEQAIRNAGLTSRVYIVGPLYGSEKIAALVDAACFCLPSRQEGFSLAITEAMACGTPVVISKNCHFPEVEQVGAGRITTLHASDVAAGLSAVLNDPAQARAMGAAGRQLVHTDYTWPQIARRLVAAYEDCLPAHITRMFKLVAQPPALAAVAEENGR